MPGNRVLPGQFSTSSVRGPCPHLHASTTSQTDLERNMLVLLPPHTPATPHPKLVPHSGSQVQAGTLLLSQSHSENIHLPQRGRHLTLWGKGGWEAGEQIIPLSHICLQRDRSHKHFFFFFAEIFLPVGHHYIICKAGSIFSNPNCLSGITFSPFVKPVFFSLYKCKISKKVSTAFRL